MDDPGIDLPLALHREIAILEEDLGGRGDCRVYRARLDNLPALLGELMVAGELDPAHFQLGIPFTFGGGPITDWEQVGAIRARADALAQEFRTLERRDPNASLDLRRRYLKLADPRLLENESVVIKVPRSPASPAFAREEEMLRKLNHRNIVRRFARIQDPVMGPCLLHEHIEGKTIEAILVRRARQEAGPLPLSSVAHIFLQLAQALSHVHAQNLCHGDLRPANVVNERPRDSGPGKPQGIVKLAGFGALRPPADALYYFAPEQLATGTSTPATDVYQLGVLLFALATNVVPYSNLAADDFRAQLGGKGPHPSRVREFRSDISPRFEAAIEGAREKAPAKRWPLSQVLEEISQLYAAREFTAQDAKGANLAAEFLDRAQFNLGRQDFYRALEMLDVAGGFMDAKQPDEVRRRFDGLTRELSSHREAVDQVRRIHKEHIEPVDYLMGELYGRYGRGAPLLAEEEKGILQEKGGDVHIIKRSLIDTILRHTQAAIEALTKIDGEVVGEMHRTMVDRASSQEEACSDLVKRMVKFGEDYRRAPGAPDVEEQAQFELE